MSAAEIEDAEASHSEDEESEEKGADHSTSDAEEEVRYPLDVKYCSVCSLPPEYCVYNKKLKAKCLEWLSQTHPELVASCFPDAAAPVSAAKATTTESPETRADAAADDSHSARGSGKAKTVTFADGSGDVAEGSEEVKTDTTATSGKAKGKAKGRRKKRPDKIIEVSTAIRKGRKHVTLISGLQHFAKKPQKFQSIFRKRFATGVGYDKQANGQCQIVVQGDVPYDVVQLLKSKYKVPGHLLWYKTKTGSLQPAVGADGTIYPPP